MLLAHLIEELHAFLDFVELHAGIDQTIVQDLIRTELPSFLDLLQERNGSQELVSIGVVGLYAVHQDAVSEVIREDAVLLSHLFEVTPGHVHFVALHATVQERIEADPVWTNAHLLHLFEQAERVIESLLPAAALDERVVGDLVKLDVGRGLHLLKQQEAPL